MSGYFFFFLLLASAGGGTKDPLAFGEGQKAAVFIFVTTDCPVANAILPDVIQLQHDYEARGVSFALVHVDPATTAKEALAHAKAYHVTCEVLLDPHHEWAAKLGATRTPESFVITPDGKTVYHGRINDLYFAPGQRRRAPTHEDLREALAAVVAGKKVANAASPSVGCAIEDFGR